MPSREAPSIEMSKFMVWVDYFLKSKLDYVMVLNGFILTLATMKINFGNLMDVSVKGCVRGHHFLGLVNFSWFPTVIKY